MRPRRRKTASILALLVFGLITASTVFAQTGSDPKQTPSAQSQNAAEVLANARQIYTQEGASKALPVYERALELYRQEGDRKGEAITIGYLGNAYKQLGQHVKALEYLQQSLQMKRELGDRLEQGKTLVNIGLFYKETSDY